MVFSELTLLKVGSWRVLSAMCRICVLVYASVCMCESSTFYYIIQYQCLYCNACIHCDYQFVVFVVIQLELSTLLSS